MIGLLNLFTSSGIKAYLRFVIVQMAGQGDDAAVEWVTREATTIDLSVVL